MSLTFLIITFLVLILLVLFVQSLFLWLGAKLVKIPGVNYPRALLTCVVITVIWLPIQAGIAWWDWWLMDSDESMLLLVQLIAAVLSLGVGVAVPWLCVKWLLRATFGRAALAALIMFVGGIVGSLALALSLMSTLVEKFVIPTGAMAPTLHGAHADLTCENCGFDYSVSMSEWTAGYAGRPREAVPAVCPNCGQADSVPASDPILTGDRILVEKITSPQRWDLIVFKYPEEPSTNFIKRLVGLPGETLEIVGGDIFIDGKRLRKRPGTAVDMWLPVHDSRYVARQPLPDGPRWEPADKSSHWKHAEGQWAFAGEDARPEVLSFSGRLTDELAYNGKDNDPPAPGDVSSPLVGDVKVECWIESFSGQGSFAFRWEFRNQRVTATVSPSGEVEISSASLLAGEQMDAAEQKAVSGELAGDVSERRHLAFAFRDGQAYVMQDGAAVASLLVGPDDIETAKVRLQRAAEPCHVEIVASRCSVRFSRIALWKDVHYRNLDELPGLRFSGPFPQWGCTDHPITLARDEHFTLGDNSARSKDSRFWGTVASDQIIGVCRWIYWPPSRRREFR